MKRKDYDLIAFVIKGLTGFVSDTKSKKPDPFGIPAKEFVFANFVPVLARDNANFNPDLFKKDCGL